MKCLEDLNCKENALKRFKYDVKANTYAECNEYKCCSTSRKYYFANQCIECLPGDINKKCTNDALSL